MPKVDKFILQYIQNDQIWQELVSTGLSPDSSGQCEAIKRMLAFLVSKSVPLSEDSLTAEKIMSMETWFWSADKIEEALSIPLDSPNGKHVSLHENVGVGFHLFKRTDIQGKEVSGLYADRDDGGGPLLPMAIVIENQSVMIFSLPRRWHSRLFHHSTRPRIFSDCCQNVMLPQSEVG